MDFVTVSTITFVFSIIIYFLFLLIGVGGISKNRKAQSLEEQHKNN